MSTTTLTLPRPDDWHVHLRDGAMCSLVVDETAKVFGRVLVMPNLKPPIIQSEQATAYRTRILDCVSAHARKINPHFNPKMALYLTPRTTPDDIYSAAKNPHVVAVKWYPAGATTNSAEGVSVATFQSSAMRAVISALHDTEMVLSIHGEVVDNEVDIFDRERVFLVKVLAPILREWPRLRVVLEHISSRHAVDFILEQSPGRNGRLAATITAHHLAFDRNAMLVGGIRPHYYCLPILKRAEDKQALIGAAIFGSPAFFLGTDTAPHTQSTKESSCGCAGAYTAPVAMPLYASVFESVEALPKLADFASRFGAEFYRQPVSTDTLTLIREPWRVPAFIDNDCLRVIPFKADEMMNWRVENSSL